METKFCSTFRAVREGVKDQQYVGGEEVLQCVEGGALATLGRASRISSKLEEKRFCSTLRALYLSRSGRASMISSPLGEERFCSTLRALRMSSTLGKFLVCVNVIHEGLSVYGTPEAVCSLTVELGLTASWD